MKTQTQTQSAAEKTVHTVTIEGTIGEKGIYSAAEAAIKAGCTHYAIEQAHPMAPGKRWIAARGRAARPMRTVAEAAGISGERADEWGA